MTQQERHARYAAGNEFHNSNTCVACLLERGTPATRRATNSTTRTPATPACWSAALQRLNARIRAELEAGGASGDLMWVTSSEDGTEIIIQDENDYAVLDVHEIEHVEHVVNQWLEATS